MQKYQEKKFDIHPTCELLISPLVSSVFCNIEAFLRKKKKMKLLVLFLVRSCTKCFYFISCSLRRQRNIMTCVQHSNILFQKQIVVCQKSCELEWSMLLSFYCLLESLSSPDFNHWLWPLSGQANSPCRPDNLVQCPLLLLPTGGQILYLFSPNSVGRCFMLRVFGRGW